MRHGLVGCVGGMALLVAAGCYSAELGYGTPSGMGATAGGVKDLKQARAVASAGRVPAPEMVLVEGMFAEHDLPLTGAPCTQTLCVNTAAGSATTTAGNPSGWLQLALSSNINPQTFQRPPMLLVACVDVSGSMQWGQGNDTPGELSDQLLKAVLPQLDDGDEVAIVAYGSEVRVVLEPTRGGDDTRVLAAIESLAEAGSTNMEAGMKKAFEIARASAFAERRVLLFTDTQPNVGATQSTEFEAMAADAASNGVSLTVFGMGTGMSPEHMQAMAHLKGGNAFTFMEPKDVAEFVPDQWPWFASPLAYDLSLKVSPAAGFHVADAYGFPASPGQDEVSLTASTVFLSNRRGALLLRLAPDAQVAVETVGAQALLRYRSLDNQDVSQALVAQMGTEPVSINGGTFAQRGVARTVALAQLAAGMRAAVERYQDDHTAGSAAMDAVDARFAADAAALADEDLQTEVQFSSRVATLMRSGAEQAEF